MPFIKAFTDVETGAVFPESFWWTASFNVDYRGRVLTIEYVAHLSQQAQAAGKRPLQYRHFYQVSGQNFDQFIGQLLQPPIGDRPSLPVEIARLLDDVALSIADTTAPNDELVSFFADATRVEANLEQTQALLVTE